MKIKLEAIQPDADSSFKILLTPNLNDVFYWHFHAEYEIVYVQGASGIRHIGDHISKYEESDLALIGPNIPHLNFDYGVQKTVDTVVVQMKEYFLGSRFFELPEIKAINNLFERSKTGLAFFGETKRLAGERLKLLSSRSNFNQLISLLETFQLLAQSKEFIELNARPVAAIALAKEQQRLHAVYQYIDANYHLKPEVGEAAKIANLTTAAFCRYFKKATHCTFTDFVNQFRINQAKKLLMQQKQVSEACYETGFENLSHFIKTFKKFAGDTPTAFKARMLA